MQRALRGDTSHPEGAATLHDLGVLSKQEGDMDAARRYYEASLQMRNELQGDPPDAQSPTINDVQGDDWASAREHYEASLDMQRAFHGDLPHPGVASTLH